MLRVRIGPTVLFALFLLSVPGGAGAQRSAVQPPIRLQPGDQLLVEIEDEPSLSGTFTVDADGFALLPAIGLIAVTGRPYPEVRDELLTAYWAQLVEPVVRITPLQRVAVLGEVTRPGLFPVDPTHRVSDLLALAGGLGPSASMKKISLVRDGEVVAVRIDPAATALTLPLRSGDQVIVGRRNWFSENGTIFIGAIASVAAATITALLIR